VELIDVFKHSSSTDGPSLEANWGMGTFDQNNKWYRFRAGQGLELDMFNCINKGSTYTIYLKLSLDSTSGWRRLIGSSGWNENGVLFILHFKTFLKLIVSTINADICEIRISDLSRGRRLEMQRNYQGIFNKIQMIPQKNCFDLFGCFRMVFFTNLLSQGKSLGKFHSFSTDSSAHREVQSTQMDLHWIPMMSFF
jgi:hypothetical protein